VLTRGWLWINCFSWEGQVHALTTSSQVKLSWPQRVELLLQLSLYRYHLYAYVQLERDYASEEAKKVLDLE